MVSACSLWKKEWSVDCASPTCNCDSRLSSAISRHFPPCIHPSAAQSRESCLCSLYHFPYSLRSRYGSSTVYCLVLHGLELSSRLRSSLAPLPKASLILSISASTHLILSLFTGAAGALAAARDANAASAGICADPYLCCCPGKSCEADDDGRVTDSVNGGCELCCRGWKCVWWMRSDDGFATWSIEL